MKPQLTFDQYRDQYYPQWKFECYSGFADPNEGRYYAWIESGHAEVERLEAQMRSQEFARRAQDEKQKKQERYDKVADKLQLPKDLEERIVGLTSQKFYNEFVDSLITSCIRIQENTDHRASILKILKECK